MVKYVNEEGAVAMNVLERMPMREVLEKAQSFGVKNSITQALVSILTDLDEKEFAYMAFKAAVRLNDLPLMIQ